jgi:hypothetical protein
MKSPALLVTAAGRFFYATAARLLALKFILSMSVSQHLAVYIDRIGSNNTCGFVQFSRSSSSMPCHVAKQPGMHLW